MRRAVRAASVMLYLCATPLIAQEPAPFTLRDVFVNLRAAADRVNFASSNAASDAHMRALESYFDRVRLLDASLGQVIDVYVGRAMDLPTIAGWNRDRWSVGIVDSITTVRLIANGELYPMLRDKLPKSARDSLWPPLDTLQDKLTAVQLAANKDNLRRFFIKYGPDAPRLNAAEVLLNYVAQLWIPGFLPSVNGRPTPNELVATYRTTDLTATRGTSGPFQARVVTSAQLGLRRYNFGVDCGTGRFADLLRPCQQSAGGFLVGRGDTPLNNPWQLRHRGGVYWARGKYHVGAIFGSDRQFVFGVDQQLLPYIF